MRRHVITITGFVALSCLVLRVGPAMAMSDLTVDDDRVQCPNARYTTIQAAVDAASPGGLIHVCPGTYPEQITISKPLHLRADSGAIVMPGGMVANTTSLFNGAQIAPAVLVTDTGHVLIEGLTVDGAANGIVGCSPILIGIFFRNASGRLDEVAVRNFKLGPGSESCQSGLGIFAQSGSGGSTRVEVSGSSVHDYQKNGITGTEAGTQLLVQRSVVTGSGSTAGTAQNGIQIGAGAHGAIEENTVINHLWSQCISVSACGTVATDVLITNAHDVSVARNILGKSQTGIYLEGQGATALANHVFDTEIFDGILVYGDHNRVVDNTITHSDDAGIFVLGSDNVIFGNWINEAPIGIWKFTGSSDNILVANRFSNTPTPVYPAIRLKGLASTTGPTVSAFR